ncbi:MAG: PEGA domain-containing protein [Planctomycetota bacterium]
MMSGLRSALWLVALAAAPGCTYLSGDTHVVVTSTPAGAEILVDGEETGRTTPAKLDMGEFSGGEHEISLRKVGFDSEVRQVFYYRQLYSSRWIDGATDVSIPTFPLFWTLGDFFTPFGYRWLYVPHELHVVLYDEGTSPVSAERPQPKPASSAPL